MMSLANFAQELKKRVEERLDHTLIGEWCFDVYFQNLGSDGNQGDQEYFNDILLKLNAMEMGPEFEISYEELERIADALIRGEKVKL